jgi:hypothetical protein
MRNMQEMRMSNMEEKRMHKDRPSHCIPPASGFMIRFILIATPLLKLSYHHREDHPWPFSASRCH